MGYEFSFRGRAKEADWPKNRIFYIDLAGDLGTIFYPKEKLPYVVVRQSDLTHGTNIGPGSPLK